MRYLPFIALLVLIIYAVVDCVRHEKSEMPVGLPKAVWVVLIVVFPGAGAIAWLVVSRVGRLGGAQQRTPSGGGGSTSGPVSPGRISRPRPRPTRPVAPDDDPDFLASLDRLEPEPTDEGTDSPSTGGNARSSPAEGTDSASGEQSSDPGAPQADDDDDVSRGTSG